MIFGAIASLLILYLFVIWWVRDGIEPEQHEWRKAAQGRALKQNVSMEKKYLD